MPIFTMTMGKVWCAQPEWVFDFTLATSGEPVEYLSEHAVHDMAEDDGNTLEDEGWTFMNAWHPYQDKSGD